MNVLKKRSLNKVVLIFLITCFISNFTAAQNRNMRKGLEKFSEKKYEIASRFFKKEVNINSSVEGKFWLGFTYVKMGEILEAKKMFLQVIREDSRPERAMSLVNLGNCYAELGLIDSAHYYFDIVTHDYPRFASGHFNKGVLFYKEGVFIQAEESFNVAIELDSSNWLYYQKRLEACFSYRNYESALLDLIKVSELNPEVDNSMNLAYCFSMLGRYEEADSIFIANYDANNGSFLNNYGMNKFYLGEKKKGQRLIEESLKINPSNSYAYRNLALIAIENGDQLEVCNCLKQSKLLGFEKKYGNEVNEMLMQYCGIRSSSSTPDE